MAALSLFSGRLEALISAVPAPVSKSGKPKDRGELNPIIYVG